MDEIEAPDGTLPGTLQVIEEVKKERIRQDATWGEQNHPSAYWLSILGEEYGEVCRAVCENNGESYREELIHVAAVAVSMAEAFDRGNW